MSADHQDKMARAYARLVSLKANLPDDIRIREPFVVEYHDAIGHLEDLGFNLAEFKIPAAHVQPIETGGNYLTDETYYSTERYVERSYFLTKLSAVLSYFELSTKRTEASIGFRSPQKQ